MLKNIIIVALGIAAVLSIAHYLRKKCPKCKKRHLKVIKRIKISQTKTCTYYNVTYKCNSCGHVFTEQQKHDNNSNPGAGIAAGAILGSMMGHGGFRGGGGHGGGSFGGGSFGGGGAGGRF